jgi:two-component system cell cycle sensor histidine kinase/response regulator CckA
MTGAPEAGGGNETILLVDDEPSLRSLVARALTSKGYNVLQAENGARALDVADAHKAPIHLVISDIDMPDMDGPELFRNLRRWYPRLRFLFISGRMQDAEADVSIDGRTAFLPKPFSMEALYTFVRYVLDNDVRDQGPGPRGQ